MKDLHVKIKTGNYPYTEVYGRIQTEEGIISEKELYNPDTEIIKKEHLPVDYEDVVEGYYVDATHFYKDAQHTELITPNETTIYQDMTSKPKIVSYRWNGSAYYVSGANDADFINYNAESVHPSGSLGEAVFGKQDKSDNSLTTTSKQVVGAINEVNAKDAEDIQYDPTLQSHTANSVGAKLAQLDEEKQDKTPVATPASASSYELAVDTLTNLGTLSTAVTFTLATAPSDGKAHSYDAIFTAGSTAPTITWPSGMAWLGGNVPTINAGKTYEVSIVNNMAVCGEFAVPNA